MTDAEATRIEEEFSIQIPEVWRALITIPALCERFGPSGLLINYKDMRRENRLYRDSEHVREYWRPEWLAIHSDRCGNVYFLDTLCPTSVFDFDHEKTFPGYDPLERAAFPTLEAFLTHIEEYEL